MSQVYSRIENTIRDRNGTIVASTDTAHLHPSWFWLQDSYNCPDTGFRIVKFDDHWFNFDLAWERFDNDNHDDEFVEYHAKLILTLFEGLKFSPAYVVELGVGHMGLRVTRSVRHLIMNILWQYRVPLEMVERDIDRARANQVSLDWDASTLSTIEITGEPWENLGDEEVVELGRTFYDAIDLTFLD